MNKAHGKNEEMRDGPGHGSSNHRNRTNSPQNNNSQRMEREKSANDFSRRDRSKSPESRTTERKRSPQPPNKNNSPRPNSPNRKQNKPASPRRKSSSRSRSPRRKSRSRSRSPKQSEHSNRPKESEKHTTHKEENHSYNPTKPTYQEHPKENQIRPNPVPNQPPPPPITSNKPILNPIETQNPSQNINQKPTLPPIKPNNPPQNTETKPFPTQPQSQSTPIKPNQPIAIHVPTHPNQPTAIHVPTYPTAVHTNNPQNNTGNMLPDDDDPSSAAKYKYPSAPTPSIQPYSSTYGQLTWLQKKEIQPPSVDISQTTNFPMPSIDKQTELTEEEVKRAFILFANSQCCYSKRPAEEAVITKLLPTTALKYSLETFTEKRFISYVFKSYNNGPIDTPSNGSVPLVWMIDVKPNEQFQTFSQKITVPHTEQLMSCFRCSALGNLRCSGCNGQGSKQCNSCQGRRYIQRSDGQSDACTSCRGQGFIQCIRCNGKGYKSCNICLGTTKLVSYIQLEIVFANHKDQYIIEKTDLPDDLIKTVSGDPLLLQTFPLVPPITECGYPEIINNSRRIHTEHRKYFTSELPILQRQILDAVLVIEAHYTWNNQSYRFWVYGAEHKIYCPDYPQSCCGCCCCCNGKCSIL